MTDEERQHLQEAWCKCYDTMKDAFEKIAEQMKPIFDAIGKAADLIEAQKEFEFEMTPEEAIEELQDQMNGEIAEYGEENIGYTIKAYEMAIEALQERTTAQDATEAAETPEFEEGELIVYQNGDTFQIGEIKRLCDFAEGAFVYYHEGDTACLTPFENMHKLRNAYCIKQTSFALDRPRCGNCKYFCICSNSAGNTAAKSSDDASECDKYTEE